MAKRSDKLGVHGKNAPAPPPDVTFFQTLRNRQGKDPFNKPFSQHVWVYACSMARATAIASVPYRLYTKTSAAEGRIRSMTQGERRDALRKELPRYVPDDAIDFISILDSPRARYREVSKLAPFLNPARMMRAVGELGLVQNGPWYDLFANVNPTMTRSQLWEATVIFLGLGGEAFWVLEGQGLDGKPVSASEIPGEIWPYGRDGWKPVINKTTLLPEKWVFEYTCEGKQEKREYLPEQLLRARSFDPHNSLRGIGAMDAVKQELEIAWKAMLFNKAFFENGGSPGGYLYSEKPLTPTKRREILEEWEERHGGPRKAGRPDVLSGLKFVESGTSHRDMQYTELMDRTRDSVLAAFRTPKSMIGLHEDVNRASSQVARRAWWEATLLPIVQYLEDLMHSDMFTPKRGDDIIGAFDLSTVEALREDLTEKTDVATKMIALGYPLNQVNTRLELGMDDQPWGEAWWRQSSLVPQMEEPTEEDLETEEEEDEDADATDDPKAEDDDADEGADTDAAKGTGTDNAVKRGASIFKTLEHWELLEQRIFAPGEKAFTSKYNKFLFDLRKEQLKRIDEAATITNAAAILFPLKEWQEKLADDTRAVYLKIYKAAAEEMEEEISALGKSVPASLVRAEDGEVEVLLAGLGRRIQKTVNTTRKQLERLLDEAIAEGATADDLKKVARATFNNIGTGGRVQRISKNETTSTVNGARQIVMRRVGIKRQEWLTAGDELVRDTHVEYGRCGEQALNFNFASITGGSYTLRFPGDPKAPPEETVNCRCVTVPVGVTTDEDMERGARKATPKAKRRIRMKGAEETVTVRVKMPRRLIRPRSATIPKKETRS